jgi:membrane-anchored protein YejM (alkaline phosphatase superfamily)
MDQQTGKYLLIAGLIIVAAGILIYFFHDYFKWIGRLPGDIKIEKENFRLYFPLTTMIIFSLVITIIIQIFKRFF